MKIWVDLATAPQVLFMQPVIAEMRKRGHDVLVTTRDFTETVDLANRCGLDHIIVGAHGGKTMFGKARANFLRAARLTRLVGPQHIALAVSSSLGQAIAAAWMRVPMVAVGDYEGQPGNHITCRVARRIVVPDVFCKAHFRRFGATEAKIVSYAGIKEQVYLASFNPDPGFRDRLGISLDSIIATMRPPSEVSAYHQFKNTVFADTIRYIAGHANTVVVLLPRGSEQRREYEQLGLSNLLIPRQVLDGPQLVYNSDLVVGAGGTMNREATVLGTPVYTQFQGLSGSVDEYLIQQGKMFRVTDPVDIPKIKVRKKQPVEGEPWRQGAYLVQEVVDRILC